MSTTKAIRYPKDLQINSETDYIKFEFHTYKPPFRRGGSGNSGYKQGPEGNLGEHITEDDVLMYMPQDVSTSMSTSWGGKEITNAAAGLLSGYANMTGGGGLGGLQQNAAAGLNGMRAIPTSGGAKLVQMGLNSVGAQTNLSMNDILGGTAGIILNPNVELLFGGPALRNIGFRFKMAARSEKEAKDMLRICRKFQFHAHARFGGESNVTASLTELFAGQESTTGSNRGEGRAADENATTVAAPMTPEQIKEFSQSNNFISVPNLCLFKYMTGGKENPYINQYKACALTNVDVNFTPDGSYSTLIGGYPTSIELSITLVETKIIYQSEINKGLGVSN